MYLIFLVRYRFYLIIWGKNDKVGISVVVYKLIKIVIIEMFCINVLN